MKNINIEIPDGLMESAALFFYRMAQNFYADPKNQAEFEAWMAARQEQASTGR